MKEKRRTDHRVVCLRIQKNRTLKLRLQESSPEIFRKHHKDKELVEELFK